MAKGTAKGAMKRENITLMCPGSFAIASSTFTRTDMVKQIYQQFGIHNEYVVGVQVGPPIKVWFTGMEYVLFFFFAHRFLCIPHSGGKEKAPAIESDENWSEFQRRLLNGKRKQKTVFASIDIDTLVPYKRNLHASVRISGSLLLNAIAHSHFGVVS